MKNLLIGALLVMYICSFSAYADDTGQEKPDYSISIIDLSPPGEEVETPSEVTSLFTTKKISGIGSYIKSDGRVPVKVTNRVELSWEPKTYTPSSVKDTYGDSLGSSSDADKKDKVYYTVEAENVSADEDNPYVTDFIFDVELPSDISGDVKQMFLTLYAKAPVDTKVMMYDGADWGTVTTFQSSSGETVEKIVGGEYAQSSNVKIRLYSEDASPFQIDVDYVALMFVYSGMDVTFKMPAGAKLEGIGDCCDTDSVVDYTKESNGDGTFDLSDFVDFDNKEFSVNYTYAYNITISDYDLRQKSSPIVSSEDTSNSIDIDYEKFLTIRAPFTQDLKLEASPKTALKFLDLTNNTKSYSVTREDGKIRFEIDTANKVNLTYSLKEAVSVKKELYSQTTTDLSSPHWVSKYAISRNVDLSLGPLTLKHRLISNSSDTRVSVQPMADYTSVLNGSTLILTFADLENDLDVTITESSSAMITNHSSGVQTTNPLPVGTAPSFRASIDFSNPSNREMKINISREMILSVLPEIEKYFKERPEDIKSVTLKPGETKTVPVVFTAQAAKVSISEPKQTVVAINQPVEWVEVVEVTNPSLFEYANVTWVVDVPEELTDYTINGEAAGENTGTQIKYTVENLSAGGTMKYSLTYYTFPVKKTEQVSSSGIVDRKIEKKIILNNPNSVDVKVIVSTNLSELPNFKTDVLDSELGKYTLDDRDGDGVNDYVKWETVIGAGEEKVIVLNSTSGDIMKDLGSINANINTNIPGGESLMMPLLILGGLIGVFVVFGLVVRVSRRSRRKKMILYIAATNDAMKSYGGSPKPASPKP